MKQEATDRKTVNPEEQASNVAQSAQSEAALERLQASQKLAVKMIDFLKADEGRNLLTTKHGLRMLHALASYLDTLSESVVPDCFVSVWPGLTAEQQAAIMEAADIATPAEALATLAANIRQYCDYVVGMDATYVIYAKAMTQPKNGNDHSKEECGQP